VATETSYELADRIAVIKGRRADGVMVLMHQLTLGFDHKDVLKAAITYLLHHPPAGGGLILDLVERDGLTYIVTADTPQCMELQGWLAREVRHLTPKSEVTAELPHAASQPAVPISAPVSEPTPQPEAKVAVPASAQTPEPETISASPVTVRLPAPSTVPPAPAPPAVASPAPPEVPLPAFLGAPQTPVTPPTPAAPAATYVIPQPKAGLAKTTLFTAVGFLVVAVVFWIVIVVVRGMK
jgi:hypothetical protein